MDNVSHDVSVIETIINNIKRVKILGIFILSHYHSSNHIWYKQDLKNKFELIIFLKASTLFSDICRKKKYTNTPKNNTIPIPILLRFEFERCKNCKPSKYC